MAKANLQRVFEQQKGINHEIYSALRVAVSGFGGNVSIPPVGDLFDISDAVAALGETELAELRIVAVPYPLLAVPGRETVHLTGAQLRARGVQFLRTR